MKNERMTKNGNGKIDSSCVVFCLPTTICPVQCKGCYARKPEKRFPAVLSSRLRNYDRSLSDSFVADMVAEIQKSKRQTFRIHESGDFYSQTYIDKWTEIIAACPKVRFYTYTKTLHLFDFAALLSLPNFNLVDSMTPLGINFGSLSYCQTLVKDHGYHLCPCGIDDTKVCMKDCRLCAETDKVCFLQH